MARRLRVEFPGAVYHVVARGNDRREIFLDDADRRQFLKTLEAAIAQFGLRLHACCLMPNHYHLVLGTPRGNLSRTLAWLQTTYTARFNARHRRRGHLFQGRYKAQLVEADAYARRLVEYVHLNPVRPRQKNQLIPPARAAELLRYPWSSHRAYGGWLRQVPAWLCFDWLAYWGRSRRVAQWEYRRAIKRAFGQEVCNPWEELRGGLVLGSDGLYQKARRLATRRDSQESVRWTQREQADETCLRVRRLVANESDDRVKIWARIRLGCERGVALAGEYGFRDSSGVTQSVKRLEARATIDKHLAQKLAKLTKLSIVND